MSAQTMMNLQTHQEAQSEADIEGSINEPTEAGAARDNTVGESCMKEHVPEAAAAHSFRYHLPTQAEKEHSKTLIVEWENQIEDTTQSIQKVDWELREEVNAIEEDFKARMQKATDDARAAADKKREPLKARLDNLKDQVKKERSFLAPIRKLPIEVVTEIITYDLESHNSRYDMQRRWQIATVCRMWRAIILGTATFWKDIDSSKWDFSERSLKTLERRLELSGSIGLNVTIHYYAQKGTENIQLRHFKALAQAGIHRWHSLTVKTRFESDTQSSPLLGIFAGKLSSLRSLVISDSGQQGSQRDVFDPLYALVAETAPPLEKFDCYREKLPAGFLKTSMFSDLKSLKAVPVVVAEIMSKTDAVTNVYVYTGSYYRRAEFKAFELPHTTILSDVTFAELSECGLDRVQNLTLSSFSHHSDVHRGAGSYGDSESIDDMYPSNTTLHFQNLRTLRLTTSDKRPLRWMLDTTALNLSRLIIEGSSNYARENTPVIEEVFVKQNNRIHITPTHFDLRMALSPASAIQIMDKWSQLVDISFECTHKFTWKGFVKSMCRKKNPPCPNLRVLRVRRHDSFGGNSTNVWREAAMEILRYRKGVYPLEEIWLDESRSTSKGLVVTISSV